MVMTSLRSTTPSDVHTGSMLRLPCYCSTCAFNRASESSQCCEMVSSALRASRNDRGSNRKRLSRPRLTLLTSPACSRIRRCLVMACRVRADPSVNREIDSTGLSPSLARRLSRVSSPSAANTGALRRSGRETFLRIAGDMGRDVLHLSSPAAVVAAPDFVTLHLRKRVEA